MTQQFQTFDVILRKRGRLWKWGVCTTEGNVVMQGSEISRPAAKYSATRALFLLLLGSPYRSNRPSIPTRPRQHFLGQSRPIS